MHLHYNLNVIKVTWWNFKSYITSHILLHSSLCLRIELWKIAFTVMDYRRAVIYFFKSYITEQIQTSTINHLKAIKLINI